MLGTWSPGNSPLLLVRSGPKPKTLSLYSAAGTAVRTVAVPRRLRNPHAVSWAPNSRTVLLAGWLWDVLDGEPVDCELYNFSTATWSPDSCRLVLDSGGFRANLANGDGSGSVRVWSPADQRSQSLGVCSGRIVWGSHGRVALLNGGYWGYKGYARVWSNRHHDDDLSEARRRCIWYQGVQLQKVGADGVPQALGQVQVEGRLFADLDGAAAPDGSVAAFITTAQGFEPQLGVALISMNGDWHTEVELNFAPFCLQWNDSSLLVSSWNGTTQALLQFA